MIPLLIAVAGGLGATCRFVLDSLISRLRAPLPLGTLVINVTGSFLLGLVTGWLLATGNQWAAVAGTGFLGGYTTFSTASVEAARLLRAGRGWSLLLHAGGMVVISVAAAALGLWLVLS
ncbi:MAG: CrcB family protein [Propionicimonas sp.]|nr:CrcB family protein [Propionicimonas sp.]